MVDSDAWSLTGEDPGTATKANRLIACGRRSQLGPGTKDRLKAGMELRNIRKRGVKLGRRMVFWSRRVTVGEWSCSVR